ncbi:hypothetical protein IJ425_06960 [bacterium]|nr:hypothetical protein [bacterium]
MMDVFKLLNIGFSSLTSKYGSNQKTENEDDESTFEGLKNSKDVLKYLDSNGDGKLSKTEYEKVCEEYLELANAVDDVLADDMNIDDLYEKMSSEIDGDENKNRINDIYQTIDSDGDGKISESEINDFRSSLEDVNQTDEITTSPSSGYTPSTGGAKYTNPVNSSDDTAIVDINNMSIEQLETEKANVESQIPALQSEITNVQSQYEANAKALDTQRETTQKLMEQMNEDNQKMQDAIQNDSNITDEQKAQMSEIESNLSQNASELSKTEAEAVAKEGEISKTDLDISAKDVEISSKEGEISTQRSTISSLKSQLDAVSNGDTEESAAAAEKQRIALKKQINEADALLKQLEQQKTDLITQKEALKAQNETYKAELEMLRAKKQQYSEVENQILAQKDELLKALEQNASQETKVLMEAYNNSKNAYVVSKEKQALAEAALDTSRQAMDVAKNNLDSKMLELDKINSLISTKQVEKANNVSDKGEVVIPDFVSDSDALKIRQLHPEMQEKVVEFYKAAKEQGLEFSLEVDGQVRTLGYQEQLKASDSSRYGTPNPFGTSSMHLMGLAIDITPKGCSYEDLSVVGKSVGLTWGGDFKSNGSKERHHYQYDAPIKEIKSTMSANEAAKTIAEKYPTFKGFSTADNKSYATSEFYTYSDIINKGYKYKA